MKKLTLLTILLVGAIASAYCQTVVTYKGVLRDSVTKKPIPRAKIKIKNTNRETTTDSNGAFNITAKKGDILVVSNLDPKSSELMLTDTTNLNIAMMTSLTDGSNGAGSGNSFSPLSYWVGASVGYNVNQPSGSGANNIVGGASVAINPFKLRDSLKWYMAIVGNIGNFVSSQTGTNGNINLSTNLSKLTQSASGLSVGVSATRILVQSKDSVNALRVFVSTIYQLNSFQLAGDTTTKSLSQWKNTVGIEFEGLKFKNGGKLHAGISASLGLFDSATFQQLFMQKRSRLASLDASIVLPLSTQFGFLLEGTYTQYTTPVYLIGVIIRTSQSK